jgi:transcription initiation factor TFIIIB Brf1 subunit/transcription initiation factor TFIIB
MRDDCPYCGSNELVSDIFEDEVFLICRGCGRLVREIDLMDEEEYLESLEDYDETCVHPEAEREHKLDSVPSLGGSEA